MRPIIPVLLLIPCLLPAAAVAEDEPVLFWRLKGLGIEAEIVERVSQVLSRELERIEGVRLIEAKAATEAAAEDPGLLTCGGQTECLLELGRAVGAARVVSGVLGNLGGTYSLDLKLVDAVQGVETGRLAQTWDGGDESLIEVMRLVATRALRPAAYLGRVSLDVNVSGVEVFIDGERIGQSPLDGPVPLSPGRHALKLARQGYRDVERFVDVVFDRVTPVRIELEDASVNDVVVTQARLPDWTLGLRTAVLTNLAGFWAPRLDLEAGYRLPVWDQRLTISLESGAWGLPMSDRVTLGERTGLDVTAGLLIWPTQLGLTLRFFPRVAFSPYLSVAGGLAVIWQAIEAEGFAPQAFRSLTWTVQGSGGLEYRAGPGLILFEVRYQHLALSAGDEGGFEGRLGGLQIGLGYRLEI